MYEYHGWASIRGVISDDSSGELEKIIELLRTHISKLNWQTGVLNLQAVNGEYHVWVAGADNHRPQKPYDPVEFFSYISQIAPGSYGLLYIWDDEDTQGYHNKFKVNVLVRGQLIEREDPFLSPCIPVIEDDLQ